MRAQCCICADLFVPDDGKDIAATPCGHVFHETCLARWLATSNTCPSCRMHLPRASVIPKLYFDLGDEAKEEIDADKLSNELQALRTEIAELKRKKEKSKDEAKDLKEKLKKKEEETETLGSLLKHEQNTVAAQQRMLQQYEMQKQASTAERLELKKIQRKLLELQRVETLITGTEDETEAILQQNSEGDKACLQQLARYCAVLKREYEQAKTEKKSLKEQVEKYRKTNFTISRELTDLKAEVTLLREQLSRSEDDLKHAEKANILLKAKLNRAKLGRQHPAETSGSFLATPEQRGSSVDIFTETPKLNKKDGCTEEGFSTPAISKPSDCGFIDLADMSQMNSAMTPDLFEEPKIDKICDENREVVKISSASTLKAPKRVCLEANQIAECLPLSALNIMKKRQTAGQLLSSTVIRKDYDGLGGTSTFTHLQQPFRFADFKITSKAIKSAKPSNMAKGCLAKSIKSNIIKQAGPSTVIKEFRTKPPLPTLDSFIDLT